MKAVLFLSALTLSAPLAAGSVREFRYTAADGIERPYVVYTPSKADGGKRPLGEVGKGRPNYWGVHDMHGMIWEWTEDFNSSLLNGGSGDTKDMFCGGGSANSTDPTNYAAFLRFGIRLSLKPNYVLRNLGFRCAVSQ